MNYNKILYHDLRKISEVRVIRSGIKPNHVGFDYLADCVALKALSGDAKLKEIYEEVGRVHGVKQTTVADGIYYAIRHAIGFHENIERKSEIEVDDSDLYAGFVISLFAQEVKSEYFQAAQTIRANA